MSPYPQKRNRVLVSLTLAGLALACGCASPARTPTTRVSAVAPAKRPATCAVGDAGSEVDRIGDLIRQDPVAYIESCLDRCRTINEFTTTFYRQERLGIVPTLHPVERIFVKWRRTPLSIKFDLPDETSEYAESVYVEGKNKNEILVLPRHGLLGLPPNVIKAPLQWSITFQKAKNPITDFGPERMLERVMKKVVLARKYGGPIIEYRGITKLQLTAQVAHHIEIVNPPQPDFPHAKVDLYIDTRLQIPAGSYCWTKDNMLDSMYLYSDMNLRPHLTDEDFVIVRQLGTRPASKPKA